MTEPCREKAGHDQVLSARSGYPHAVYKNTRLLRFPRFLGFMHALLALKNLSPVYTHL